MSLYRKVLIPTIVGLMVAGAAQAQLLPTWESHITLTQQDMEMIHNAVTNQIHGKPVGTAASWTNAGSSRNWSAKARNARTSTIRCDRGRRFIPSTIISPAVCNRTGPESSPEPSSS